MSSRCLSRELHGRWLHDFEAEMTDIFWSADPLPILRHLLPLPFNTRFTIIRKGLDFMLYRLFVIFSFFDSLQSPPTPLGKRTFLLVARLDVYIGI